MPADTHARSNHHDDTDQYQTSENPTQDGVARVAREDLAKEKKAPGRADTSERVDELGGGWSPPFSGRLRGLARSCRG
jgi:hypothetical protein